MSDKKDPLKNAHEAIRGGWDKAGRELKVDPLLEKTLIERGVHPTRVAEYLNAKADGAAGRGDPPNIEDFSTPRTPKGPMI